MGQAINDIRHMLDLVKALRQGAEETDQTPYSETLMAAAADLEKQAEKLSEREGCTLL